MQFLNYYRSKKKQHKNGMLVNDMVQQLHRGLTGRTKMMMITTSPLGVVVEGKENMETWTHQGPSLSSNGVSKGRIIIRALVSSEHLSCLIAIIFLVC